MTLDELLLEWSYRTKKGYPCLDNPSDIKILKTILERLNIPSEDILDELEDEKTYGNKDGEPGVAGMENSPSEVEPENDKSFSKEDLILLIKSTSISDQDAAKLAAQIQDLETSNPIKKYLELKDNDYWFIKDYSKMSLINCNGKSIDVYDKFVSQEIV